jgi:GntR family transcriptional regulator
MHLVVRKNAPLGIKEQLKSQIRTRIKTGQLAPGQGLPSAKDLAALLNVNRNTVSQVYKELENEGLLTLIVGSGTYVNEGHTLARVHELETVVDDVLARAASLGFSRDQVLDILLSRLIAQPDRVAGRCVLVIDCNYDVINDISDTLIKRLGVETRSVLIQDLEKAGKKAAQYLEGIDLVVCGFNHVEEYRRVFPKSPVELVAVLIKPDLQLINELMDLPPGTKVGFVCANQRSTETLYNTYPFASGLSLVKILAGLDNAKGLKKLLRDCDVIFATKYVFDKIQPMARPDTRVVKVDLNIDPANVDLIRDRLARTGAIPASGKSSTA